DRNRSHWSTSKTPSYTKSVSWQHHHNERKSKVKSLPGADSPTELEAKAAKIQKDYLDGKR
ncbi:hypothetical protein ACTZVG_25210, partial [Klebsiella pneumoniae]